MSDGRPALVLVHGGMHAGDCWDLTIAELHRLAPHQPILAVDLPGRRGRPADLSTITLKDWVGSVIDDIDDAKLQEVILVGHSLAGAIVPAVGARLGPMRLRGRVFVACFVPQQSTSVVGSVGGLIGWYARWGARRGRPAAMPKLVARLLLCNGMTAEQRRFTLQRLYPESARVIVEPVEHGCQDGLPPALWIRTTRDRLLPTRVQRRSQRALAARCSEISIAAGHDVMVSRPGELAALLLRAVAVSTRADPVEEESHADPDALVHDAPVEDRSPQHTEGGSAHH